MFLLYPLLITLHLLAAVVWVGGMFYALLALRPSLGTLDLEPRLRLWSEVLSRFFLWVWIAIVVLLTTGYGVIYALLGGMQNVGLFIHVMSGLGILMMMIFGHTYFSPFRRMRRALAEGALEEAERRSGQIRLFMTINLLLGLAVSVIAVLGRYGVLLAQTPAG